MLYSLAVGPETAIALHNQGPCPRLAEYLLYTPRIVLTMPAAHFHNPKGGTTRGLSRFGAEEET
jgi:hypothetical protein